MRSYLLLGRCYAIAFANFGSRLPSPTRAVTCIARIHIRVRSCALIREMHNAFRIAVDGDLALSDLSMQSRDTYALLVGWWVTFAIPWRMLHYFYGVLAWALWFTNLQAFPATPCSKIVKHPPVVQRFHVSLAWMNRRKSRADHHVPSLR